MKKGFLIKFNIDMKRTCFCVASPFLMSVAAYKTSRLWYGNEYFL